MKKLIIVGVLFLAACQTPDIKTDSNFVCNPPVQEQPAPNAVLDLFTTQQSYEKAKQQKQWEFENCIKNVQLLREFQMQELQYQQLKAQVKGKKK